MGDFCAPVTVFVSPLKYFFGTRFPVRAYADATEIPCPVGATCGWCTEAIDAGSDGTIHPFRRRRGDTIEAVHIECQARALFGTPGHLLGTCRHGTGEEPEDQRSWRDQGRESFEIYLAQHELFGLG